MVTAADILKKSEIRRSSKSSTFQPVSRRAWDYLDKTAKETTSINTESQPIELKEERNSNENRNNNENKWEQNGNENRNTSEQIRIDNRNKWEQKEEQSRNKFDNDNGNKLGLISPTNHVNSYLHSDGSVEEIIHKTLITLAGHQKEIMRHITSHLKSKVGVPYIVEIFQNILAVKIKATLGVTRVSLKRLVEKKVLTHLPGERGRNGCSKFQIPENVVKFCYTMFNDPPSNINIIGNEIGNKLENTFLYSSSNKIINTTTSSLPEEWERIDFSLLDVIGFSKTQLSQLFEKQSNTPEIVAESLKHFAFALDNNPKVKAYPEPLNVLMGVLRKGGSWFEKNYISPKEKALSELLEQKKQETERIQKLEKDLMEEEFKSWMIKLSQEEKVQILNGTPRNKLLSGTIAEKAERGNLFQHFMDKVYGKN